MSAPRLFDADDFARKLRVRIAERGITQAQASIEIGCSTATLSRVCHASVPDVENYFRMQAWLNSPTTPNSKVQA